MHFAASPKLKTPKQKPPQKPFFHFPDFFPHILDALASVGLGLVSLVRTIVSVLKTFLKIRFLSQFLKPF